MGKKDKRVDSYIKKSELFAQPILIHIRKLIHQACPKVEETMKWQFPHFDHNGIMCSAAAFKKHCTLSFWRGKEMKDSKKILSLMENASMGYVKISDKKDLPADSIILNYLKEAVRLNETKKSAYPKSNPIKSKIKTTAKKELALPKYFMDAVKKNKKAIKIFKNFNYTFKKEYVEWVVSAKTDVTKEKRMKESVKLMAEGKTKNWKYR